jgi:hypothetical protein
VKTAAEVLARLSYCAIWGNDEEKPAGLDHTRAKKFVRLNVYMFCPKQYDQACIGSGSTSQQTQRLNGSHAS